MQPGKRCSLTLTVRRASLAAGGGGGARGTGRSSESPRVLTGSVHDVTEPQRAREIASFMTTASSETSGRAGADLATRDTVERDPSQRDRRHSRARNGAEIGAEIPEEPPSHQPLATD